MALQQESWAKSSHSGGTNCVEAGVWNKSTESVGGGACVETTADDHVVLVRDTKVARTLLKDHAPTLAFGLSDWEGFVDQEKNGRAVSAAAAGRVILAHELSDGSVFAQVPNAEGGFDWVKSDQPDVVLEFTPAEVDAWGDGTRTVDPATGLGEFDLSSALQDELAAQRLAHVALQGAGAN